MVSMSSGAIYPLVNDNWTPACKVNDCFCSDCSFLISLMMLPPKSAILNTRFPLSSENTRMFSTLMSKWNSPCLWPKLKALQMWIKSFFKLKGDKGPFFFKNELKLPSFASSYIITISPSIKPVGMTSVLMTRTMFGCYNWNRLLASFYIVWNLV